VLTPERRRRLLLFVLIGGGLGLTNWLMRADEPPRRVSPAAPSVAVAAAAPAPPPLPAAAPAPPSPPPPAPSPPAAAAHDEATDANANANMARIRASARSHPDDALAALDALDRAHPDAGVDGAGASAEERAALRVDALVAARRIGPARDAAEVFLARYPRSPRAQHIEVLTGVHPHPTDPAE
jgi:hypothetical protein